LLFAAKNLIVVATITANEPASPTPSISRVTAAMVAQYRQFAADYRRLAAILTKPADKRALELFATVWDRAAENREAMLRSN
jgi:hypothetical protein